MSDAGIEAVAIASPAVTHYEMAKKALEFGKDVYVGAFAFIGENVTIGDHVKIYPQC